jgi:hypothetical protein
MEHAAMHTRESLGTQIKACDRCHGQGIIHGDEDARECLCLKRLQLFERVGSAIFNARPPVYDERLDPTGRLLIQAPWTWVQPRILGMCATHWGTRVQVVTDLDLRDATFRDKGDLSVPPVKEMMAAPRLVIMRLGMARKSEGLDGIIAEALARRENGPLWVRMPHDFHSRTPRLMAALELFRRVNDKEAADAATH